MRIHLLLSSLLWAVFSIGFLACDKDDDNPSCETFSSADSVCFCKQNPESGFCQPLALTVSLVTEEEVALTPHPSNGTLWTKGFAIGNTIYLIDRESDAPQAFWKYNLDGPDAWTALKNFPATGDYAYGLTGSANGKGYASQYASAKFWEYDPTADEWTPLTDMPFTSGETHWVEYNEKIFLPVSSGIYEFNTTTKTWTPYSTQTSSGFGAIYRIGADMYWYNINNDFMNHFNLDDKSFETIDLPDDFGSSVTFNSPFVIGSTAYVISSDNLWIFSNESQTWTEHNNAMTEGSAYVDDVFVIDGKAYLLDNGYLKIFE